MSEVIVGIATVLCIIFGMFIWDVLKRVYYLVTGTKPVVKTKQQATNKLLSHDGWPDE